MFSGMREAKRLHLYNLLSSYCYFYRSIVLSWKFHHLMGSFSQRLLIILEEVHPSERQLLEKGYKLACKAYVQAVRAAGCALQPSPLRVRATATAQVMSPLQRWDQAGWFCTLQDCVCLSSLKLGFTLLENLAADNSFLCESC